MNTLGLGTSVLDSTLWGIQLSASGTRGYGFPVSGDDINRARMAGTLQALATVEQARYDLGWELNYALLDIKRFGTLGAALAEQAAQEEHYANWAAE